MNRWIRIGLGMVFAALVAICSVIGYVQWIPTGALIEPEKGMRSDMTMVLGASVKEDGSPSDALRDRLQVAVNLYAQGSTKKIFLSGDDGAYRSDEIDAMKQFVLKQNVPPEDVLFDGKGYRTYESCKHFAHAAQQEHASSLIVVTQRFHIARAIYLCDNLGAWTFGVASDLESYKSINYFWARDLLASAKAWWDINIWTPQSPV